MIPTSEAQSGQDRYLEDDPHYSDSHSWPPNRKRRSIGYGPKKHGDKLLKTITVRHQDEFWHDIDAGQHDEVSSKLGKSKPGYKAYKKIMNALAYHSPAKHIGTIGRGRINYPELSIGDRAFGQGYDFNDNDMDAFHFTPEGQRFFDQKDFFKYIKAGKLPIGKLFKIDDRALTDYSVCWVSKKNVKKYNLEKPIDELSIRNKGFKKMDCDDVPLPGVFSFEGLKKSFGKKRRKNVHYVYFFRSRKTGKVWRLSNLNVNGIMEYSPIRRKTGLGIIEHKNHKGKVKAIKMKAWQKDWGVMANHEMPYSGSMVGMHLPHKLHYIPQTNPASLYWSKATSKYGYFPH